jgi:hypothetical protein
VYGKDHEYCLFLLEIKKCEYLIDSNVLCEVEKKIYEWKPLPMNKKASKMYHKICYKYYEIIGNNEDGFDSLIKYLDLLNIEEGEKTSNLAGKLVRFALLNKCVYNFTSVALHPIFPHLSDEGLKAIFLAYQNGDIHFVENNLSVIEERFPGYSSFLKEKIYLVALVNMSFYKAGGKLYFDEIQARLGIKEELVICILLKALGLNLIRGRINGEKRGRINGEKKIITFTHVLPRVLSIEELKEMKKKFTQWRIKVNKVFELMK